MTCVPADKNNNHCDVDRLKVSIGKRDKHGHNTIPFRCAKQVYSSLFKNPDKSIKLVTYFSLFILYW